VEGRIPPDLEALFAKTFGEDPRRRAVLSSIG